MLKWLLASFFVASSVATLFAGSPISFSPQLPAPWIVHAEKDLLEKNPHGHVVALVNTNEPLSMTISLMQPSKADAGKDFEQRDRTWCAGFIDGTRGNDKLTQSKLTFKTIGGQKIAETTFTISSKDGIIHGLGRCWLSKDRTVGWSALGMGVPVENQKQILDIAASIKIDD